MSKIFKPRRAQKSTMTGPKANTVLAAGEMFVEFEGIPGQSNAALKFGDGTSTYTSLPYALKNTDVSTSAVTIVADSSPSSTIALNNVTSNTSTGALIGSLKQAIALTKTELTVSLEDLSQTITGQLSANNAEFYFDYKDGKYGFNTSNTRGADTFYPFKSNEYECIVLHVGGVGYTFGAEYDFAIATAACGNHSSWIPTASITVSGCTLSKSNGAQTNYGTRPDGRYGFDTVAMGLITNIVVGSRVSASNANLMIVYGFKFP